MSDTKTQSGQVFDAWEEAKRQCLSDLSPKEQQLINTASLEGILADVKEAEVKHSEVSKSRNLSKRLKPVISGIEQYGKAFDILVGTAQGILSPLWGGIRILLHLAGEFGKYFEKLVDMLEQIGDNISRLFGYAGLFSGHTGLNEALSKVFIAILRFCFGVRRLFYDENRKRLLVGSKTMFKLSWKPFKDQFGDTISDIRDKIELVENQANYANMLESKEERLAAADRWDKITQHNQEVNQHHQKVDQYITGEVEASADRWDESKQHYQKVDEYITEQDRSSIINWVGGALASHEYDKAIKGRQEGTCEWIFEREEYRNWKKPTSPTKILWMHGIPGAGKTYLSAKIVETLRHEANTTVAYFFYTNIDAGQKTEHIVRSWVVQLASQRPDILAQLKVLYEKPRIREHPPEYELWGVIQEVLDELGPCYLVIDGLDEATPRDEFLRSLTDISASSPSTMRFLIVSRNEADIRSALFPRTPRASPDIAVEYQIEKGDNTHDIKSFVRSVVSEVEAAMELEEDDKEDSALLRTISETLLSKSGGMFLWVRLVRNALKFCQTTEDIEETLENLPEGLDAAYKRVLERLDTFPVIQKKRAIQILRWSLFARRPLTVEQLVGVLAIREGDKSLKSKQLIRDPYKHILELCSPFIEIRQISHEPYGIGFNLFHRPVKDPDDFVCIVHFTVKEFLLSSEVMTKLPPRLSPYSFSDHSENHLRLATVGLTYLLFTEFEKPTPVDPKVYSHSSYYNTDAIHRWISDSKNPHLSYLLLDFVHHVREAGTNARSLIKERIIPLMVSGSLGSLAIQQCIFNIGSYRSDFSDWALQISSQYLTSYPVHFAACLDTPVVVDVMRENVAFADLSHRDEDGFTPLLRACLAGGFRTAQLLLDRGANIEATDYFGKTSLHLAARGRVDENVLMLLLDRGANIQAVDSHGDTALHSAARGWESEGAVDLLLDRGANIHAVNSLGKTVLHLASERITGEETVKVLLDRGANVQSVDSNGRSALHTAVNAPGCEGKVKLLLDRGADIEAVDSDGRTALNLAVEGRKNEEAVKLLLDRGANIQAVDSHGRPALHNAAKGWLNEGMVKLLLDKGACVQVLDLSGGTALHLAIVGQGSEPTVQLLLDRGVDLHAVDSDGRSALHSAAGRRRGEVSVKLLLDKGINIQAVDSSGKTALHIAAGLWQGEGTMKLLLDKGINTQVVDSTGKTALHFAAGRARDEGMVELLLERGMDIQAADSDGKTALHLAAEHPGNEEKIKLLLNRGADIAAVDSTGKTALDLSLESGPRVAEIVDLLRGRRTNGEFALRQIFEFHGYADFIVTLFSRDRRVGGLQHQSGSDGMAGNLANEHEKVFVEDVLLFACIQPNKYTRAPLVFMLTVI